MLCKSCKYPLKQLAEPRCPECGRAFDPNNSNTYFVPPEHKPRRWLKLLMFGGGSYLVAFAWMFIASLSRPFPQRMSERFVLAIAHALILWLVVLGAILLVFFVVWLVSCMATRLLEASRWPDD